MKFDIYGRFQLEVLRERNAWVAYRLGPGARSREDTFVIPKSLAPDEIASFLDDMYHELAGAGDSVRLLS